MRFHAAVTKNIFCARELKITHARDNTGNCMKHFLRGTSTLINPVIHHLPYTLEKYTSTV